MSSLPSEFSPQKSKLGARYTPGLFDLIRYVKLSTEEAIKQHSVARD